MTEAVEQLKSQASVLSVAERADLAYFLLTTLEPEEDGVEEAWREEIARRVAQIRSGQVIGRPIEEVLAELRERYPSEAIKQDLRRRTTAYEANLPAGSTREEVKARLLGMR